MLNRIRPCRLGPVLHATYSPLPGRYVPDRPPSLPDCQKLLKSFLQKSCTLARGFVAEKHVQTNERRNARTNKRTNEQTKERVHKTFRCKTLSHPPTNSACLLPDTGLILSLALLDADSDNPSPRGPRYNKNIVCVSERATERNSDICRLTFLCRVRARIPKSWREEQM
jgi:hypothetical protein